MRPLLQLAFGLVLLLAAHAIAAPETAAATSGDASIGKTAVETLARFLGAS